MLVQHGLEQHSSSWILSIKVGLTIGAGVALGSTSFNDYIYKAEFHFAGI